MPGNHVTDCAFDPQIDPGKRRGDEYLRILCHPVQRIADLPHAAGAAGLDRAAAGGVQHGEEDIGAAGDFGLGPAPGDGAVILGAAEAGQHLYLGIGMGDTGDKGGAPFQPGPHPVPGQMPDNAGPAEMGRQDTGQEGRVFLAHVIAGQVGAGFLTLHDGKSLVRVAGGDFRRGDIALAADEHQPVDLWHHLGKAGADFVLVVAHTRNQGDRCQPVLRRPLGAGEGRGVKAVILHLAHEEDRDFHVAAHCDAAVTSGVHLVS